MCVCAVSYTHLDVYKRQKQGSSERTNKDRNNSEYKSNPRNKGN